MCRASWSFQRKEKNKRKFLKGRVSRDLIADQKIHRSGKVGRVYILAHPRCHYPPHNTLILTRFYGPPDFISTIRHYLQCRS